MALHSVLSRGTDFVWARVGSSHGWRVVEGAKWCRRKVQIFTMATCVSSNSSRQKLVTARVGLLVVFGAEICLVKVFPLGSFPAGNQCIQRVKRCGLLNVLSLCVKTGCVIVNNPSLKGVALLCTDPNMGDRESFDNKDSCKTTPMPLQKDWLSPWPPALKVHFFGGASLSPLSSHA